MNKMIKLLQFENDAFIARGQAKRLLKNVSDSKKITFDFESIDAIGPSFADEIFRVFANQNPNIEIISINTNVYVQQMIDRAKYANVK